MVVGWWLQGGARNGVAYIDCLEGKSLVKYKGQGSNAIKTNTRMNELVTKNG